MTATQALFIHHPDVFRYCFGDEHPFNQQRLKLTIDLLRDFGALPSSHIKQPAPIGESQLELVHTAPYIEAAMALSQPEPDPSWRSKADNFGLGRGDTPYFPDMHAVTSAITGGSVAAVESVILGTSRRALHLGGGLHHAMPNRAAGFCVYNDASVAIAVANRKYGARVLYVDTDVHHGDGVQHSFYTDPEVCTFSIHETGKYLFPGTGFVHERGEGDGFGTCFNMPVEPYTEDESWMDSFRDMLVRVVETFKPDVIVSQHGCDAHAYDPLAHVHCSMSIYLEMPKLIKELADAYCHGRWVALGGGGYDIWRVVPRAWALLWLTMIDSPVVRRLESGEQVALPHTWLDRYQPHCGVQLPTGWLDDKHALEAIPRREEIRSRNEHTKQLALQFL